MRIVSIDTEHHQEGEWRKEIQTCAPIDRTLTSYRYAYPRAGSWKAFSNRLRWASVNVKFSQPMRCLAFQKLSHAALAIKCLATLSLVLTTAEGLPACDHAEVVRTFHYQGGAPSVKCLESRASRMFFPAQWKANKHRERSEASASYLWCQALSGRHLGCM